MKMPPLFLNLSIKVKSAPSSSLKGVQVSIFILISEKLFSSFPITAFLTLARICSLLVLSFRFPNDNLFIVVIDFQCCRYSWSLGFFLQRSKGVCRKSFRGRHRKSLLYQGVFRRV